MDAAVDGVHWWSLIILEGYSRTMLAGMIAPAEATWVALMVLYTACLRYGTPVHLVSDSGGAYTSADFEAVCTRLQIQHETIVSTQGESYQNLMETHFNIQRRLYDYQFSLTRTPAELEDRHQAFIQTYNTTAHQGLLKDQRRPPIPVEVLGEAKGRVYAPDELARAFSQGLYDFELSLVHRSVLIGGISDGSLEEGRRCAKSYRSLLRMRKSSSSGSHVNVMAARSPGSRCSIYWPAGRPRPARM
jgi:transposase InsO family protein